MSDDNRSSHPFGWKSLEYFARTQNRLRILDALCETPQTPATLEATLEIPRSTLRRLVTDLEEEGWLYATPSKELHPSLPARLLVDTLTDTLESLDKITQLAVHLTDLPPAVGHDGLSAIDADDVRANLDQIQVTLPTAANPHAPILRFADRLAATDSFRLVVPAVHPTWGSTIQQHVADGNSCELITTRPALRTVADQYHDIVQIAQQDDAVRIYSTTAVTKYGIGLLDNVVVLAGYDVDRRFRSFLEVSYDCSTIESWAAKTYTTQRDGATEVPKEELASLLDESSKGEGKQEHSYDELS